MILVDGKCYCKSGPMNGQGKCGVCPKELSGLLRRADVSHVKKDALNAQKMVV